MQASNDLPKYFVCRQIVEIQLRLNSYQECFLNIFTRIRSLEYQDCKLNNVVIHWRRNSPVIRATAGGQSILHGEDLFLRNQPKKAPVFSRRGGERTI